MTANPAELAMSGDVPEWQSPGYNGARESADAETAGRRIQCGGNGAQGERGAAPGAQHTTEAAPTADEAEARKAAFRDSIKEPKYVIVTPEMTAAGLDRLRDLRDSPDLAFVVDAIYMAMEYERRSRE